MKIESPRRIYKNVLFGGIPYWVNGEKMQAATILDDPNDEQDICSGMKRIEEIERAHGVWPEEPRAIGDGSTITVKMLSGGDKAYSRTYIDGGPYLDGFA